MILSNRDDRYYQYVFYPLTPQLTYILVLRKLTVKRNCHTCTKQITIEHRLDVEVSKQQLLNMTFVKHCYTNTCSCFSVSSLTLA